MASFSRRSLEYAFLEEWLVDCKLTGAPAEVIRQAARRWSKVRGEKLGQFRTPRLLPSMEYETTANCAVHEGCHSGAGLVWRFRGRWETETTYKLHVSYADDHSGDVRTKTRSAKASSPTLSVQDHQHVIEAAEFLLMHGMKPTPSAVAVRLKAAGHDRVADKPMRSVLQWRHRNFGDATSEFLRSEEQFESFASQYMTRRHADTQTRELRMSSLTVSRFQVTWLDTETAVTGFQAPAGHHPTLLWGEPLLTNIGDFGLLLTAPAMSAELFSGRLGDVGTPQGETFQVPQATRFAQLGSGALLLAFEEMLRLGRRTEADVPELALGPVASHVGANTAASAKLRGIYREAVVILSDGILLAADYQCEVHDSTLLLFDTTKCPGRLEASRCGLSCHQDAVPVDGMAQPTAVCTAEVPWACGQGG
ncbi:rep [Symbiodinium natans]|uniref:Rep protein n=1 Tax=Symbiodinium natans TaxID=878477 RepID=A0A812IEK0_9DINO|nr:rep [Symbiodinium natans]